MKAIPNRKQLQIRHVPGLTKTDVGHRLAPIKLGQSEMAAAPGNPGAAGG
jgi:hypothetical protein